VTRPLMILTMCWLALAAARPAACRDADAAADSVLAGLDLRARVGQMLVVYRAANEALLPEDFGGVLLFSTMLADTAALRADLRALQDASPVPLLVCLDQEGVTVSRLDAAPGQAGRWPGAAAMGAWPTDRVQAEGRRVGVALAALGVNVNLAPVLDSSVTWDGAESWMGHRGRAFGTGDDDILPAAVAFARGCRQAGVACVGKHFPGYDVAGNTDERLQASDADTAAVAGGAARFAAAADVLDGVMMASIIYTATGPGPAVMDPALVAAARTHPRQVVMTDDLWAHALRHWGRPDLTLSRADYPDADWARLGRLALAAGNDLLLVTYPAKAAELRDHLVDLAGREAWARARVDASAGRILRLKARLGLLPR
jgi:beta-N-acetylhexosaminidase